MVSKDYAIKRLRLDEFEYQSLKNWYDEIVKKRGSNYWGAIGGEITFKIVPTSIGEIIEAKCGDNRIILRKL